jgi:hypothetical protein
MQAKEKNDGINIKLGNRSPYEMISPLFGGCYSSSRSQVVEFAAFFSS